MKTWKTLAMGSAAAIFTNYTYPLITCVLLYAACAVWPNASPEEALKIIEEEKAKAGVTRKVELRVYYNDECRHRGYAASHPNGQDLVMGANISTLDRLVIRHEMMHFSRNSRELNPIGWSKEEDLRIINAPRTRVTIDDPNFNEAYESLRCRLWEEEPACDIYALTGLKL